MFVAGFIGSPAMNLLEGELQASGEELHVRAGVIDLKLPAELRQKIDGQASRDVVLGIRPEDIADGRLVSPNGHQMANLRVDVVEQMGSETYVYLTSGELTLTARMSGSFRATPGDGLPVAIDAGSIHLFDPATERAIV